MTEGYRVFNGKIFSLHCRSRTKASANRIKGEMSTNWYVRITKNRRGAFLYSIWIRRK